MWNHYEYGQDVQDVFELLTDPDLLVDRCLALGELEASCEIEENGDDTIISLTRTVERELPRVLAKVPLIGGQVEKFVGGQVADGCQAEMEYVEEQLG